LGGDEAYTEDALGTKLRTLRLVASLPKTREADVLGKQLLKAGTSIGANYREARRGRSRADFASKIGICLQEADESLYWLELLVESGLVRSQLLSALMSEAEELIAIFAASLKTARSRSPVPRK
jgi:four helix bundle protein